MSVTIGSLSGDDQRLLEYLGLLSESEDEDDEAAEVEVEGNEEEKATDVPVRTTQAPLSSSHTIIPSSDGTTNMSRTYKQGTLAGIPWFEEMIEGSRLGRLMKSRRVLNVSDDQSTTIQWEVSEWTNDGSEGVQPGLSSGKRKRGQHTNVEDS
jgi:hypothetical protein